jgi:hypothetical protein
MARTNTPVVTVVQGDDGPDIVATIQQDASGDAMVLTNRKAFVVLVNRADSSSYVAKWDAAIEDSNAGKIRISWVKDAGEDTSYLDDLIPGTRYELQLFLGRTDLPPLYLTFAAYYEFFNGQFNYTGGAQEGSPVFKHATEDLYLSRSPYDGNGVEDEYVWLVTSLRAATWEEVKAQDKATLEPADLATTPVWNYKQVLDETDAPDYIQNPQLDNFETSGDFIITPTAKYQALGMATSTASGSIPAATYYESPDVDTYWYNTIEGAGTATSFIIDGAFKWAMFQSDPLVEMYENDTAVHKIIPEADWYKDDVSSTGALPVPTFGATTALQNCTLSAIADPDAENRGTQTILTRIPIAVKEAYRLAPAVEAT